ncbi:hypothetical protein [Streptomyces sp. NPDC060035]|uniref:hypothetical protein n=1 Tax=Streptomyces sp. NPDC060035 TaxID=3347044 RepID=UPI003691E16C
MRDDLTGHDHEGRPMGRPADVRAGAAAMPERAPEAATTDPLPSTVIADAEAGTSAAAAGDAPEPGGPGARAPEIAYHPARRPAGRRGSADPVKLLMHRHRELCERAVDPLEIAAGLEAHGLTDRTAARYRHRDVFSLAEELYARVPGAARPTPFGPPQPGPDTEARAGWTLLALLPGAACLATVGVLRGTEGVLDGGARFALTSVGALLVFLGLRLCLRSGPLRAPDSAGGTTLYVCWLLGYVVYGDDLLRQVISGGPDGHWTAVPAPLLGLALAVAPAAWCTHLFAVHARHRLVGSHGLAEFGDGVRPLLLGLVALFLCALAVLLVLADLGYGGGGALVAPAALGVLLFLARLLIAHGFPEPAATGLAFACAVEVAAPFLILAGRLPGLDLLARPVEALVMAAGTGGVPTLACGFAALGLLIHASVALSRASAHATA